MDPILHPPPDGDDIDPGTSGPARAVDAGADGAAEPEAQEEHHVRPVDRFRQNTASGAVVAAFALGFRDVFDPERKGTVGIEQPADSAPIDSDGVELRFDPHSAAETVVVVRPPPADE